MTIPKPIANAATNAPAKGILCMVIGTMLLTSNDAITKWLLNTLHPGDVMAWRGLLIPAVYLRYPEIRRCDRIQPEEQRALANIRAGDAGADHQRVRHSLIPGAAAGGCLGAHIRLTALGDGALRDPAA